MKIRVTFLAIALMAISSADAQIINPKETAKRKVEGRTNRTVDKTIDKGLDKLEEGIGSIFKKKDVKKKDENSNISNNASNKGTDKNNTNLKSNSSYDFEPGNKVLYFDNFERLNIGDFPAEFNTNASGEVVNVSGKSGKWLSMTKNGAFIPESIKELPDNFTLEFEIGILGDPTNNYSGFALNFTTDKNQLFRDNFFGKGSSVFYLHPGGEYASFVVSQSNASNIINNEIPMPQWNQCFTDGNRWKG